MDKIPYGSSDFSYADTSPAETDTEWQRVLEACKDQLHIGFGLLDSFLSEPDLDRRIGLVEIEAATNDWLRGELRDVLHFDQSKNMNEAQMERLRRAAGIERSATESG